MNSFIKKHQTTIILIYSIIAILITYFFKIFDRYVDAVLFYWIIPFALIMFLFKEKPKAFGFGLGNIKTGLLWILVIGGLSILTTFLASQYLPEIKSFYMLRTFNLEFVILTIIYMVSWEFLLRGFLLFGLLQKYDYLASNIIQTFIFFLAHIGKPGIELYSTLATGLLFGHIAYKSKSFWPMAIIHSIILISVVLFTTL